MIGRLLLHEIVFGLFLVLTGARLVIAVGLFASATLVYAAVIAVNLAVLWWAMRQPSDFRWRCRLLFYALAMNLLFEHMRLAVPLIHAAKEDAVLQAWDQYLFGGDVALRLQSLISPWLTELLSAAYGFFIPYLFVVLLDYGLRPDNAGKAFYTGMFCAYGIGFAGYTLMPALGPYLAEASRYDQPLVGYFFTDLVQAIYPHATNYADAFPSLHCAMSAIILACDAKFRRRRFLVCIVPVALLWLSTIYLRYHYAVDVLAGLGLSVFGVVVVHVTYHRLQRQEIKP